MFLETENCKILNFCVESVTALIFETQLQIIIKNQKLWYVPRNASVPNLKTNLMISH